MLYTLQDKHNAESNGVIQLFFVRTAQAGAAPSHPVPSLPLPASSLPPSLGFAGKQHALVSKSGAREDQLPILHSSTKRAERIWEGHSILHVHHDRDQAMPICRRKTPLLSTHSGPTTFCSRALGQLSRTGCRVGLWQSSHLKGSSDKHFQLLSFYPYACSPLQG